MHKKLAATRTVLGLTFGPARELPMLFEWWPVVTGAVLALFAAYGIVVTIPHLSRASVVVIAALALAAMMARAAYKLALEAVREFPAMKLSANSFAVREIILVGPAVILHKTLFVNRSELPAILEFELALFIKGSPVMTLFRGTSPKDDFDYPSVRIDRNGGQAAGDLIFPLDDGVRDALAKTNGGVDLFEPPPGTSKDKNAIRLRVRDHMTDTEVLLPLPGTIST